MRLSIQHDLDPDALVASARAFAGLTDLGDERFLEPMARFLEAAATEANLNLAGVTAWKMMIQNALVNRLRMMRDVGEHPEILDEDVSAPVVILGLPRTGTTKLQRMMSAAPGVQALLMWRLLNPAPFPDAVPGEPEPRIFVAQAYETMLRQMAPDLWAGHSVEALQPEEETLLMETSFETILLGIRVHVPSFIEWLRPRAPETMYEHLRLQLQYLQWQDGGGRGRPWIMKSPLHLPNLGRLVETFPRATFLHCHRDPARCIPSMARLSEAYRITQSDVVDRAEIGATQLELWSEALDRYLEERQALDGRVEILDVAYLAIVDEPMAVIDEIFRRAGVPLTPETESLLLGYAAENRQHRYGRHDYSLERFGLSEADIDARFGAYRAAFPKGERMSLTELVDAVLAAEKDVVAGNPRIDSALLEAEGVRYLARLFSAGALTQIEAGDPAYPQLVPFVSAWVTWGGTNPDSDYLYATVHPDYTYRLRGRRGAVHLLAFETFAGDFDDMARISACDMRLDVLGGPGNIEFGPDGEFEIVLGTQPPVVNGLRIPDVPGHLLVRFCWYDWDVADRPSVVIEREGAAFPPPPPTMDGLERRLERFADFLRQGPQMCARAADMYYGRDPGSVVFPPWSLHGDTDIEHQLSFHDQLYGQSHFALGADEAAILEVAVPASPYWSFNLSSPYLENTDWHLRQNSINGHQAVVDPDGVFRAVICHSDPGVPNWLDTGGQTTGVVQSRFLRPASTPEVSLRTVPLGEVRAALPDSTAVVTPQERQESVRKRVLAVQRRGQG